MTIEDAWRSRMVFEAAQDPQITKIAEATSCYLQNEDPDADVVAPFAELATPQLARFGLYDRSDADQVLIKILANIVEEQYRGEA